MQSPALLITIPFSHYCEKARWALDRAAIPYREDPHIPVFHMLATVPRGGRTVPMLRIDGRLLKDSTDILQYLDSKTSPGARLYPEDAAACRECEELEDYFDTHLGPATRRLGYYHLLDETALTKQLMKRSGPAWEQLGASIFFPVMKSMMVRSMRIDAEGARRSRAKIDEVFANVASRLADGRSYLLGDRFTAADLTFATLAAPVLSPPGYGDTLPGLEEMPPAMAAIVRELRETPAGAFGLRLYGERSQVAG